MHTLGILVQIWLVGATVTIFVCLLLDAIYRERPPSDTKPIAPTLLTLGTLRKLK